MTAGKVRVFTALQHGAGRGGQGVSGPVLGLGASQSPCFRGSRSAPGVPEPEMGLEDGEAGSGGRQGGDVGL